LLLQLAIAVALVLFFSWSGRAPGRRSAWAWQLRVCPMRPDKLRQALVRMGGAVLTLCAAPATGNCCSGKAHLARPSPARAWYCCRKRA
jgi:hypothetical protein